MSSHEITAKDLAETRRENEQAARDAIDAETAADRAEVERMRRTGRAY